MNRTSQCLLFCSLATCAPTGYAGEPVDQSLEVAGDVEVAIDVRRGSVAVEGWNEARVHVSGTRDDRSEAFVFEQEADRILIEDQVPDDVRGGDGSRLTIRVPRSARLRASHVSASLTARDVAGRARLRTVSGEIVATGLSGDVDVHTVSGEVQVAHAGDAIRIDTVSGDVEVTANATTVDVETVSGDLDIDNRGALRRGSGSTVSGDVDYATALGDDADLSLESVSGDVTLVLRGPVDARVDVDAGPGGEIENGLGGRVEHERKSGPGETATVVLGAGRGAINANTLSGTVELRAE